MGKRRNIINFLKSKITIEQYHRYLMIFSCVLAVTVFLVQLVSSSIPLSQMDGIQMFQSFWLPLMFVFIGAIFLVSGRAINDQIETEKNLIIDQIDKLIQKNFNELRNLRENDELKEIMDKVHELADSLKSN